VPEIVDPAQRIDAGSALSGAPLERSKVMDIEVATTLAGKYQRRIVGRQPFERVERPGLKRHGAHARFGLGRFELTFRERAADEGDAFAAVDVEFLKGEPLGWAEAGCGGEDNHWPVARTKRGGDRLELVPGLERMLLFAPSRWVVDADFGWVDVDQSPDDGSVQDLPQRLGCLKAKSGRNRHPPLGNLM
jgi:hypothetical protein